MYTTPFAWKHSSTSSQIARQLPHPCRTVPSRQSRSSSAPHHGAGVTARRGFGSRTLAPGATWKAATSLCSRHRKEKCFR